jgi:hypothetical protein
MKTTMTMTIEERDMNNEKQYQEMFSKFRAGQISEKEWFEFCRDYLMALTVWQGVVKRLRWT